MSREGALWIGGLEPYMDEEFLMNAMKNSGEDSIQSIKVIKNKFTGAISGYGFVNFPNDQIALKAMHKLNGKIIPNSRPPARYKLNHNSNRILPGEKNYSIWVGDLSPEVDDLALYEFFSARFQTIISAKVVLEESGTSKGFGFIRFGNETEQQTALTTMQGISGLGLKPIKVSIAVQKAKDPTQMTVPPMNGGGFPVPPQAQGQPQYPGGDYNQYYNQYNNYWSNMAAWQQYNNQQQQPYYPPFPGQDNGMQGNPPLPPTPGNGPPQYHQQQQQPPQQQQQQPPQMQQQNRQPSQKAEKVWTGEESIFEGPLNQPVQHTKPLDYTELNKSFLTRSVEVYQAMEESGWK